MILRARADVPGQDNHPALFRDDRPLVLACDIGSSSLRVAIVGLQGEILQLHSAGEGAAFAPTAGEIDPQLWWGSFAGLVERLTPALLARVQAIAICGLTRTHIMVDETGTSLRPAITWRDARADAVAAELRESLPADWPERSRIEATHPAARLAWIRRHEPAVFARIHAVIEPKDYVNSQLTGRIASDPVSSARLAASASSGILARLGAAGVLPTLLSPVSIVGRVRDGLQGRLQQLTGCRVLAGSNDTWAAVLGLGALQPGMAYNISGTTEVLGLVGRTPALATGLMSVDWGDGLFQLGGPGQNGADCLAWLLELLGRWQPPMEIGPALETLLAAPAEAQPLLFLPFLQGERTPFWDTALRGSFIGLNRRHGAADMARAVLEGVGFLNRLVLERAEGALGARTIEIRAGGGAARSAEWCQIKADICARPMVASASAEPGLTGGGLLGAVALGAEQSLAAAQRHLPMGRRYDPDPASAAFYDRLYPVFETAIAALRPLSHTLAAMMRPGSSDARDA